MMPTLREKRRAVRVVEEHAAAELEHRRVVQEKVPRLGKE